MKSPSCAVTECGGFARRLHVLYVGSQSGTSRHRARALADLGMSLKTIDTSNPSGSLSVVAYKISHRLRRPLDLPRVNRLIVDTVSENPIDILWVDKGLLVRPSTLQQACHLSPATRTVSYSPDDMFNPSNQSKPYLRSIPVYDLHVTTKSYNVAELREAGARDVLFVNNAFDPHTHSPLELTEPEVAKYQADVSFIGGFEAHRAEQILTLANAGIEVTVWSADWPRRDFHHPNLRVHYERLNGIEYTKAIVATRVNLGFLRKCNRDRQTTRTMEIPASEGFLLAERTEEHCELFAEGREAEYFGSPDELVAKCRHYLAHADERRTIAAAGRRKCLDAGYSNHDTLRRVLDYLLPGAQRS